MALIKGIVSLMQQWANKLNYRMSCTQHSLQCIGDSGLHENLVHHSNQLNSMTSGQLKHESQS